MCICKLCNWTDCLRWDSFHNHVNTFISPIFYVALLQSMIVTSFWYALLKSLSESSGFFGFTIFRQYHLSSGLFVHWQHMTSRLYLQSLEVDDLLQKISGDCSWKCHWSLHQYLSVGTSSGCSFHKYTSGTSCSTGNLKLSLSLCFHSSSQPFHRLYMSSLLTNVCRNDISNYNALTFFFTYKSPLFVSKLSSLYSSCSDFVSHFMAGTSFCWASSISGSTTLHVRVTLPHAVAIPREFTK